MPKLDEISTLIEATINLKQQKLGGTGIVLDYKPTPVDDMVQLFWWTQRAIGAPGESATVSEWANGVDVSLTDDLATLLASLEQTLDMLIEHACKSMEYAMRSRDTRGGIISAKFKETTS